MAESAVGVTEPRPGVHRFDIPLGDRRSSLYVIPGSERALLFDTGVRGAITEQLLPALEGIGVDPARIGPVVVSHCDVDHFGGVQDARRAFPASRILAHEADRAAIENVDIFLESRGDGFRSEYGIVESAESIAWLTASAGAGPVDEAVDEGTTIDLGDVVVEVNHLPGHTHGHLGVSLSEGTIQLIGDAILGDAVETADGSPAFPPTYRYVSEYRDTIRRISQQPPEVLLTAHYPTMEGDEVVRFLETSQAFVDRLEQLVIDSVGAVPDGVSLPELLDRVNPGAGRWPVAGTRNALAYPVVGHLEDLVARGVIERIGSPQQYRWRAQR